MNWNAWWDSASKTTKTNWYLSLTWLFYCQNILGKLKTFKLSNLQFHGSGWFKILPISIHVVSETENWIETY